MAKASIQPRLKAYGFKKRGLLWNRERSPFIDVVSVQEAEFSAEGAEVFTVNIGVFVPSFFEAVWTRPLSGFATEADCAVRLRLGDLLQDRIYGDAEDQWWEIASVADVESEGNEVRRAIEEKAIPFLEGFDGSEALVRHLRQVKGWQSKNPLHTIYRALAESEVGDTSTALELLKGVKSGAWKLKAEALSRTITA